MENTTKPNSSPEAQIKLLQSVFAENLLYIVLSNKDEFLFDEKQRILRCSILS